MTEKIFITLIIVVTNFIVNLNDKNSALIYEIMLIPIVIN